MGVCWEFDAPNLARDVLMYTTEKGDQPMEMFLMAMCMGLFAFAIAGIAFGAATRSEEPSPAVQPATEPEPIMQLAPGRFFGDNVMTPVPLQLQVPIEALLLQIESHVRLEQAAAESFLQFPTPALLQSRTMSPLVH